MAAQHSHSFGAGLHKGFGDLGAYTSPSAYQISNVRPHFPAIKWPQGLSKALPVTTTTLPAVELSGLSGLIALYAER